MRLIALLFIALLAYAQITQFPAAGGSSGNATTVNGAAVPASQTFLASNGSSQLIAGVTKSVFAYQSAPQAIPGSYTDTPLQFDVNDSNTTNTPSMHSTTSNKQNFVVPSDGFYEGTCFIYSDSTSPATEVITAILLNGAQLSPGRLGTSASNTFGNGTSFYYFMHAADVVTCHALTGSPWNTNSGLGNTEFYMHSVP